MNLVGSDYLAVFAAVMAILAVGSTNSRTNLLLYAAQTLLIAIATWTIASLRSEFALYVVALSIAVLKAAVVPLFLSEIIRRLGAHGDRTLFLRPPVAMHLSVALLGFSFVLAQQLPFDSPLGFSRVSAGASISMVLTGLLLMLTRTNAISQIVGFLVIENGIYLFALTQTFGMPLFVEMGVLLDVLVGVMISGLLVFGIKRSFEHVDVQQMTELKE